MKYAIALVAGLVVGVLLVLTALYYNPLARENIRVPLTAEPGESVEVFYRSGNGDTVLRTNHEDRLQPRVPEDIIELWEPALDHTAVWLTVLRDVDGVPVGVGVRMSALSEATRPLTGELLLDSVWNVHLPGRGSLFVASVDNLWPLARAVVLPAWRGDQRSWRGNFSGDLTVGPGATHVASMLGGGGAFSGVEGEARESLSIGAFSFREGMSDMSGSLLMAVTERTAVASPE